MNEQLKALTEQVGKRFGFVWADRFHNGQVQIDALVELVRQDEREACAVLVEGGNHLHPKAPDAIWAKTVAKLIRARGNHGQD